MRSERLCATSDVAAQRAALAAGLAFEGVRRGAGPAGEDLLAFARLATDPPGPRVRLLPDPPPEGLSDGVVRLRPELPEDAQSLWETSSDPDSMRWAVRPLGSFAELCARIEQTESSWVLGQSAHWTVLDGATGAVVGDAGVRVMDAFLGRVNLGYAIHPAWRGRGLAVRAARLVSGWAAALPGVARVEASANVLNAPSVRVLERAGFRREGVLLGLLPHVDGGRQDVVQFSWPTDPARTLPESDR
jgi:RimJ/RimL family protein N-acetyltransferase